MKGILVFIDESSPMYVNSSDYTFCIDEEPYGYNVYVNIDNLPTFADIFSDTGRKDVLTGIRDCLFFCRTNEDEDTSRLAKHLASFEGHEMDLLKMTEYFSFELDFDRMEKFVENNPEVFTKKIYIRSKGDFSREDLDRYENIFKGHIEQLRFDIEGNVDLVGIEECKETFSYIEDTAKKVRSLGFSPLEELMYVYDLVRDRIYKEEDKDEDFTVSRDLSKVLLGVKIVCCGFSVLMNSILTELGFKSKCYFIRSSHSNERGHERIVVIVDDDKYGIHGVYYFDPTWDCRKDDSRDFLYSYRYFAKTKKEIEDMKKGEYVDTTFGDFGLEFAERIEKICLSRGVKAISERDRNLINSIAHFFGDRNLIPHPFLVDNMDVPEYMRESFDNKSAMEKLYRYARAFLEPIEGDVFMEVLFNVRKMQYYEEPDRYPFDYTALYNVLHNSFWELPESEDDVLLRALFGRVTRGDSIGRYRQYMKESGFDIDVHRILLTKTLSRVRDKKNREASKIK